MKHLSHLLQYTMSLVRALQAIDLLAAHHVAGFVAYVLTKLDPARLMYTSFKIEGQRASIVDIASILEMSIEPVEEVPSPEFPLAGFFQEYFETGKGAIDPRDPAEGKEGKEEKGGNSNHLWENHHWKMISEVLPKSSSSLHA